MFIPDYSLVTQDPLHRPYFRETYRYALKNSNDKSTKNGALIVDEAGRILVYGANHIPEGLDKAERFERPEKYIYTAHAETSTIITAASEGVATKGRTIYCTWAACEGCGLDIVLARLARVVVHKQMMDQTRDEWKKTINIAAGMFHEKGIEFLVYDGEIGEGTVGFMNGEFWKP